MFLARRPTAATVRRFIEGQRQLPFSYPEVGGTRGELPAGYTHDHNRIQLGHGREVFQRSVSALRDWKQFDLGWVAIVPETTPLQVDATVAIQARTLGVWSLSASRVIYLVNEVGESMKFGFAYGTLPDHVERGEERFIIEWQQSDDSVWYDIVAFSQPRHPLVRLSSPFARLLQKRFARDSLAKMVAVVNNVDV
jgi:uncharacterized protein (UPF0548 family)